ncbi:MAG: YfcE family phosphodiesterase [Clostridia bacterium]|nr:YfcE family phosphodiesterase [Clostridia bacterium]
MHKTIIVFSDSHGSSYNMQTVVDRYPEIECVIHLGDGAEDTKYLSLPPVTGLLTVKGNCDHYSKEPPLLRVQLCGLDIIMCHGDGYGVKFGMQRYESFAAQSGCDIALFGHTHRQYYNEIKKEDKTVYVCNPGSISRPSAGRPSYCVIKTDGKSVSIQFETV